MNLPVEIKPSAANPTDADKQVTTIIYALYAASILVGVTCLVAIVMNYVKKDDVVGTYLESHFRWQIRTFWFAFLWFVVAGIVSAPLVLMLGLGIFTFFLAALIVAAWIVYRVVRGWLALRDRRTMYT